MEVSKELANVVYELMAGTTSGHMANVPNNPTLYAVISAATGNGDNCYAARKVEFAEFLRAVADELASEEAAF